MIKITKLAYYIDICCGDLLDYLRILREICLILAPFALILLNFSVFCVILASFA
jgi:hypothetical protein